MSIISKFKNQRLAAQIIEYNKNPDNHPELMSRVAHCLVSIRDRSATVDLFKKEGQKYAHLVGLQRCGSPWNCHICASILSEYRCGEIEELIRLVNESGYHLYTITYTLPHYAHESCQTVYDRFSQATTKMKKQKLLKTVPHFIPFQAFLKRYGCVGYVTTKEPLYGPNGWHIHTHALYIFEKPLGDLGKARDHLWEQWLKACDLTFQISDYPTRIQKGFYHRSVRLDALSGNLETMMAQYLTKSGHITHKEKDVGSWGMEQELTKGHLKKSEFGLVTPWGMLDRIRELLPDDKEAVMLKQKFFEYTETFKGASFVRWSPGLRKRFGFEEKTDQEIVDETSLNGFYGYFEYQSEWKRNIVKLGLRGFMKSNTDKPWNEMVDLLNQEIERRIYQNQKEEVLTNDEC